MQFEYSQALHIDACVLSDEWFQFCSQLMHKLLSDFEKFDLFKFVVLNHEKNVKTKLRSWPSTSFQIFCLVTIHLINVILY